jgi:OmpA-OmpF porin, OOP family
MKKILSAFALAAASLFSSAALAQAYVSGALGAGHFNLDCSGGISCDKNGTAFKVLGGYDFGGGLAGELGYGSFGKAKSSGGAISAEVEASGLMLGLAFHAPMASSFGLTGRLGMINMKTEISGSVADVGSASLSETNLRPYFGFAVTYAFTQNLKIELGADFSRAELDGGGASVRALTAGLRLAF